MWKNTRNTPVTKTLIMMMVALSMTIIFFIALFGEERIRATADENRLIYVPSVGELHESSIIAQNASGDIIISELENDDLNVVTYNEINVLKTNAGEKNKIKITTQTNARNVKIMFIASLFDTRTGVVDILNSAGESVLDGSVEISETNVKEGKFFEPITADNIKTGGDYYIWSSERLYIKTIEVSYGYSQSSTEDYPFMESYELTESGKLPKVANEKINENGIYRFIGWVNEENKAVDYRNTLPKGKYKTVYVAVKSRLAKILINTPTSICFGYYVYFLNEDMASAIVENGSVEFEGILSPENTNKVTRRMLDQYEVSGNAVEINMAIYDIPKEFNKTNIEADLAVYFNNGLAIETTEKCTRSIAYVAEAALYDTKDVEDSEYRYPVNINGESKFSRYTVAKRNILSELCGVYL